jgi:hypothetical protein
MRSTWSALTALALLAISTTACAEFQKMLEDAQKREPSQKSSETSPRSSGGSAGLPAQKPEASGSVDESELAGFFELHPAEGGGKVTQWPRVAVTIVSAPEWHLGVFRGLSLPLELTTPSDGCWKFSIVIWESEKNKRELPESELCAPAGSVYASFVHTLHMQYQHWAALRGESLSQEMPTTGSRRTGGPKPPDTPIPYGRIYQEAHIFQTWTGAVIQRLANLSGIDYAADQDRRLWFNLGDRVAPPSPRI